MPKPPQDPRWLHRPPPWWLLFIILGATGLASGISDALLRSHRIIWQRWYILMECAIGLLAIGIILRIYRMRDAPVHLSVKLAIWMFVATIALVFWRWS